MTRIVDQETGEGGVLAEAVALLGLEAAAAAEGAFRLEPKEADGATVDVVYLGGDRIVLLVSRLGYVTYGREAVFRLLLQQHYLGDKTAGAVFSVDPVTQEVVLQRAIPVGGLTGEQLADAISAFAKMSVETRRVLG